MKRRRSSVNCSFSMQILSPQFLVHPHDNKLPRRARWFGLVPKPGISNHESMPSRPWRVAHPEAGGRRRDAKRTAPTKNRQSGSFVKMYPVNESFIFCDGQRNRADQGPPTSLAIIGCLSPVPPIGDKRPCRPARGEAPGEKSQGVWGMRKVGRAQTRMIGGRARKGCGIQSSDFRYRMLSSAAC